MDNSGIYTIGHSNRTIDEFIDILFKHTIGAIVDVRAQPYSPRFPHFSKDKLRTLLDQHGIKYHWAGHQLGGQRVERSGSKHIALSGNMQAYADHMETDLFQKSATQIVNLSTKNAIALLCAEYAPEVCHRRLLSDYLVLNGHQVKHILTSQELSHHQLSPEARRESAALIYDRLSTLELNLE